MSIKLKSEENSYPEIIEIQLHNSCNADCIICPYEKYKKEFKPFKSDSKILMEIISQIKHSNGQVKRIIPYLNNEPFIDNEFILDLKLIRKELPNIIIEVSTNLSVVRDKDIEDIFRYNLIDDFRVSFFGGNERDYKLMMPKLNFHKNREKIDTIIRYKNKYKSKANVSLVMVASDLIDLEANLNQVKHFAKGILSVQVFGYLDRAGNNFNKNNLVFDKTKNILDGCSRRRNIERMCINAAGNTVLCSQDWFAETSYGTFPDNSILQLWGAIQKKNLDNMVDGRISSHGNFICKRCKLANIKSMCEHSKSAKLNFSGDKYIDCDDKKKFSI